MPQSFVLLTALPPTKGHISLIDFADQLSDYEATVIVSTQPGEPWAFERAAAIRAWRVFGDDFIHMHEKIEQNPDAPGFWDMWRDILVDAGFKPGDYIVASEHYGLKLAEVVGGVFMPYDIDREILPIKATPVRNDPFTYFRDIAYTFQRYLRRTVTVFGAESVGKTTLSHRLAGTYAHWIPEWARPYLETVGNDITTQSMTNIWHGQAALQRHAHDTFFDKPYIVQDTDLFSTVGYWDFWNMATPAGLVEEAIELKSDLYFIPQSNIPFEPDPLRYGGDKREASDEYWIDLCKRYDLNYHVLTSDTKEGRLNEAWLIMREDFAANANLDYTREYNDH
jgi:HTH-type transcriptional repressor of NAD biosynthesis genes